MYNVNPEVQNRKLLKVLIINSLWSFRREPFHHSRKLCINSNIICYVIIGIIRFSLFILVYFEMYTCRPWFTTMIRITKFVLNVHLMWQYH
jgi:hypothetical protein